MRADAFKKLIGLAGLGAIALGSTACGKVAYTVGSTTQAVSAPGFVTVPPKVDILMVEDDTGSMSEAYSSISYATKNFLANLDQKGWDYHFAVVPLTTVRSVTQVVGSKYDGNSPNWVAPFPGAVQGGAGTILSTAFRTLSTFTGFLSYGDISSALNGAEPGLYTLQKNIMWSLGQTNFRRSDALFTIVDIGNGNDDSNINYCRRPADGVWVPCGSQTGSPQCTPTAADPITGGSTTCDSRSTSLAYYQSWLISQKAKFYAAVANQQLPGLTCLGGTALIGSRYQSTATATGGRSYDVCNMGMSSILDDIASNLQYETLSFRQQYIFIPANQTPTQVTIYANGDSSQAQVIPPYDSATGNGWKYVGYVNNVYTYDKPANLNQASGYAIQLFGTAKFSGAYTASVTYHETGAQNSQSN